MGEPEPGWVLGARPKIEPAADQRTAAKSMVSLFVALVDEGMTERQALVLLGTMFGTFGASGTENPDG